MAKKSIVFITGFMGCGKTTYGKQIAKALGFHFIDLDNYIMQEHDQSILDMFKELGETAFRKLESEALATCIAENDKTIIALGGGTPCYANNLEELKKNGFIIYIKLDAKILFERLEKDKDSRPLITEKEKEELKQYIVQLLQQREPIYSQAHLTVDGSKMNIDAIKASILEVF